MGRLFEPYRTTQLRFASRAQIWRLICGLTCGIVGQIAGTVVIFFVIAAVSGLVTGRGLDAQLESVGTLGTPLALFAALATFLGMIAAVWLVMPLLHGQNARWLLSSTGRLDLRHIGVGFVAVMAIGLVAIAVSVPFQDYVRNASWAFWLTWLVPILGITFVQVFAEELLFRGYLQSHLAARFHSPLIWMGVPALLFAGAHAGNALAFGANAWLVLLAPLLVGILAADVTARTGGISGAVGLHLANNTLGLLILAIPGPFGVVSLYHHPVNLSDIATVRPLIMINVGVILAGYIGWMLIDRRRAGRLQRTSPVVK